LFEAIQTHKNIFPDLGPQSFEGSTNPSFIFGCANVEKNLPVLWIIPLLIEGSINFVGRARYYWIPFFEEIYTKFGLNL